MKNKTDNARHLNWLKSTVFVAILSVAFHVTVFAEAPRPNISFQVFYDELQPYGDWISDPDYGYVWVPYADHGFQPYATNGHWVMSPYGNTWVSNYDWGWAAFHYGRWYFDDYLGWAWVPGYEWGPAWVNWRAGGDYYGWAPLMPGMSMNVSINIPTNYWVFVPRRRFISRNVYNYYVAPRNVYRVYNQTTVINNTYVYNNKTYVSGPARREIERVSRRSVPVYQVANSNNPGRASVSRNTIRVYQPSTRETVADRNSPARPSRVISPKEHQANRNSRTTSRTAPASRATLNSPARVNSGNSEVVRPAGRAVNRSDSRNVRSNNNNSVARTPSAEQRKVSSPRESVPQSRQQSPVNRQQPSVAPSRTRTPTPQQRTPQYTAPRQQSAPASRTTRSPRQQEVKNNVRSSTASPSRARENSGSATRRTGSGSPRGNR